MSDNLPSNERPNTPATTSSSGSLYTPSALWGGAALILLGSVFLLQTMGILSLNFNWWALFILIPGLGMFYKAYQMSQQNEGLDRRVRGTLIGGTAVTMVAVIFLFDLSWSLMWPVFLILAGVAFFVTARQ